MKKKKILSKFLFYYSAVASFFIAISIAIQSEHGSGIAPMLFVLLFLPVTSYFIIEFFRRLKSIFSNDKKNDVTPDAKPRKSELIIVISIFFILIFLGIINIYKSTKREKNPSPQENASSTSKNETTPKPLVFKIKKNNEIKKIIVKITDSSPSVNIRKKPTIYSEVVGKAKDRETFRFTGKEMGFYKIELKNGEMGYIYSKYAEEVPLPAN